MLARSAKGALLDLDPGLTEFLNRARRMGRGIGRADHHARNARLDQRVRARAGASVMVAGLKRDDDGRSVDRFTCVFDRRDLRMIGTRALMESATDNCPVLERNSAYIGIGAWLAAFRQLDGKPHRADFIDNLTHCLTLSLAHRRAHGRSSTRELSSLRNSWAS